MEDNHEILRSYLELNSVAQQQIDSYNRFISIGIKKVIEANSMVEPDVADFSIKFKSIRIEPPQIIESDSSVRRIMPNEALSRNLMYSSPMYLTYVPVISGIEKLDSQDEVYVGELPVMVKSNLCYTKNMSKEQLSMEHEDPDDPGGYFIIKGTERVLVGIEDLAPNKMLSTKENNISSTRIFSTTMNFRSKCTVNRDEYGIYTLLFPTISKGVDLILVLHALGLTNEEILNSITNEDVKNDFEVNIDISNGDNEEFDAKQSIINLGKFTSPNQASTYQEKRAEIQLDTYILPHLGSKPENRKDKGFFLIKMAERSSLLAYNYIKQDDRDHYGNKRVRLAGDLMEELFNTSFRAFIKDIKYHIERATARGRKLTVKTNINPDSLTDKILYSMSTGSWPAGQTGVSQVLDRYNIMSTYAHLRRVKSPLAKKHPHFKARDVHGTTIGKICPSETPEGPEVGLTKYLAIMSKVSVGADEDLLEQTLKNLKIL